MMNVAWVTLMGILGFICFAVLGFALLAAALVRLLGGGGNRSRQTDEEARLLQELHQGLGRMEERVETLETLLLERDRKGRE